MVKSTQISKMQKKIDRDLTTESNKTIFDAINKLEKIQKFLIVKKRKSNWNIN